MSNDPPIGRALMNRPGFGRLARSLLSPLFWARDGYNRLRRSPTYDPPTDVEAFREVQERAREPTDLSDHLERLFVEALGGSPDTIVELGVRGGESTFVFERVARLAGAELVSVDVDETSYTTDYDGWHFVQSDDIEFAEGFGDWCDTAGVDSTVDVLFIDTSHLYDHTVAEIDAWFPHLADDAVVFFHDTNMRWVIRHEDGTVVFGWNNGRGVIEAIEDRLGCSFDETERFATVASGFVVEHYPLCSGLTVLRKTDSASGL